MKKPNETTVDAVREWVWKSDPLALDTEEQIPLVRWGEAHNRIAAAFAEEWAARAVSRALDEALNSGDGSYRP
jgi:hypothetical protein